MVPPGNSPEGPRPGLPRRQLARILPALILVAGLAAGAGAGWMWASRTDHDDRQAFDLRASQSVARLTTAIQSQVDLALATRATIDQNPLPTNRALSDWFASSGATRLEHALGVTYIQRVATKGELVYFLYGAVADPVTAAPWTAPFALTPKGSPPPYCMTRLLALAPAPLGAGDTVSPPGLDWCATSMSSALTSSTESGDAVMSTILTSGERVRLGLLGAGITPATNVAAGTVALNHLASRAALILVPVYRGAIPLMVGDRQSALVGWAGAIFDLPAMVEDAVSGQAGIGLTLSQESDSGAAPLVVGAGRPIRLGGLTDFFDLGVGGNWSIAVTGAAPSGLASGSAQGAVVGSLVAMAALLVAFLARRTWGAGRGLALSAGADGGGLGPDGSRDPLTGLPTRPIIIDRAEHMLARSRRNESSAAALVVGLDDFSDLNALYGWEVGDKVLTAVAKRLLATLREVDTVGRLAGDEFVVLAEGEPAGAPDVIAERLLDGLRTPFRLGGEGPGEIAVSASVGIALGPRLSADNLVRDAGIAMRQAKQAGRGRCALFEQDTPQATESRLALEEDLRRAVAHGEFALRYQPIFDIESRIPTGVEALVRWERRDGRILPPDHFLTALERAGLMEELGRWVVHEACRHAAELRRRGRSISVFVNVAASQLETDSLDLDVSEALSVSRLDPNALVLEVAEMSLLTNTDLVPDRLAALKALGVRIAVDDFGTGFSSLAYLRRLPIDILKIERSFIVSMATPEESSMVLRTLVDFGKSLGLEVIAEGIEHEGQIDPLLATQCDLGQGFLYARPMTAAQLELFLTMNDPARAPLWVVPPG